MRGLLYHVDILGRCDESKGAVTRCKQTRTSLICTTLENNHFIKVIYHRSIDIPVGMIGKTHISCQIRSIDDVHITKLDKFINR